MRKELREAGRALARDRPDESLVHLWNVLEPARLAGDRGTLRAVAQLASQIRERGEPVAEREAERLLEEVRETAEREGEPEAAVTLLGGGDGNGGGVVSEGEAADEAEGEQASGGLARFILPLIFLIVVLVNVVNALTGD